VEYIPSWKDVYDRTLAHVFVDGKLLSILLIKAGLAYETVTRYGDETAFPDLAKQILEAARSVPTPPFEYPGNWRKKHQVKPGQPGPSSKTPASP